MSGKQTFDGITTPITEQEAQLLHYMRTHVSVSQAELNGTGVLVPRLERAGLVHRHNGWLSNGTVGETLHLTDTGRRALSSAVLGGFTPAPSPRFKLATGTRRLRTEPDIFRGMR